MLNLLAQVDPVKIGGETGIQGLGGFQPKPSTFEDAPTQLSNLISTSVGGITIVAGLLFLVYMLIAGVQWVTAGGDKNKVEAARDRIVNGIIGLVVVIASYAIVGLVGNIFGLDILNPAGLLETINSPEQ